MCNHLVAESVRERIKKEGLPSVSRRNFLKMGSVLTAGAALAPHVARADMHAKDVVDLTHVFTTDFPVFPGGPQAARETLVSVENDGYYIQRWNFAEHTGTHMDFPGHFIADGLRTDTYPVEMLVGPSVVIDISARAENDADTCGHRRRSQSLGNGEWRHPGRRLRHDVLGLGRTDWHAGVPRR